MDNVLEKIISEMSAQNKKQYELTDFLGLNYNTFGNWKSGLNQSYLKYLHAIADFLEVSVEYLRGETDEKKKPPVGEDEGLTNEERLLLALFNKVPQEEKSEAIRKIIDVLNN